MLDRYSYIENNIRAIEQLFMEILRFKELGVKESVVTNAVVLVFGVSNVNGNVPQGGGGYLPSYKVVLQCIGN